MNQSNYQPPGEKDLPKVSIQDDDAHSNDSKEGFEVYIVKKGETLTQISFKLGVSIKYLQLLNECSEQLFPGQVLKVRKIEQEFFDQSRMQESGTLIYQKPQKGSLSFEHRAASQTMVETKRPLIKEETNGDFYKKVQDNFETMQSTFQTEQKRKSSGQDVSLPDMVGKLVGVQMAAKEARKGQKWINKSELAQLKFYIEQTKSKIKTEAYYMTSAGKVRGFITLSENMILFVPTKCKENQQFGDLLFKAQMSIDLQDLISFNKIRTLNDSNVHVTDPKLRKYYVYDYYIQLTLATVNGQHKLKSLKSLNKRQALQSFAQEQAPGNLKNSTLDLTYALEVEERKEKMQNMRKISNSMMSKRRPVSLSSHNSLRRDENRKNIAPVIIEELQEEEEEEEESKAQQNEKYADLGNPLDEFFGAEKKERKIVEKQSIIKKTFGKIFNKNQMSAGKKKPKSFHESRKSEFKEELEDFFVDGYVMIDQAPTLEKQDSYWSKEMSSDTPKKRSDTVRTKENLQIRQPVANVFIRFSHRNQENTALTNHEQKEIVENVYQTLSKYMEAKQKKESLSSAKKKESSTFVPYYDPLLEEGSLQVNKDLTENQNAPQRRQTFDKKKFVISPSLPHFQPISCSRSNIISEPQRLVLQYFLPPHVRMLEWKLLFTISKDGTSFQTFKQKVKGFEETMILIKDDQKTVFGAFCSGQWKNSQSFFGDGESWVFKFQEDDDIDVYEPTGKDEQYLYYDGERIIIGGSGGQAGKGSAIYVQQEFKSCSTGESQTFGNKILSGKKDFDLVNFEVWGFSVFGDDFE